MMIVALREDGKVFGCATRRRASQLEMMRIVARLWDRQGRPQVRILVKGVFKGYTEVRRDVCVVR